MLDISFETCPHVIQQCHQIIDQKSQMRLVLRFTSLWIITDYIKLSLSVSSKIKNN